MGLASLSLLAAVVRATIGFTWHDYDDDDDDSECHMTMADALALVDADICKLSRSAPSPLIYPKSP
jgi:hypothetical protein